jgi:hypothetical protein
MTKLTSILLLFTLLSCTSSKKENDEAKNDSIQSNSTLADQSLSISPKDWIDSLLIRPDSSRIIVRNETEKFIQLTKNSKLLRSKRDAISNHLAAEWGLDTSFVSHDHWLEFYTADGRIKILGSAGTDNSALWLVTFDNHQKAVDRYEISGGECDGGWNEYEGKVCTCQFKRATQINDSTFVIRKLWECKEDWNAKTEFDKLNKWVIYITSQSKIIERGPAEHTY